MGTYFVFDLIDKLICLSFVENLCAIRNTT